MKNPSTNAISDMNGQVHTMKYIIENSCNKDDLFEAPPEKSAERPVEEAYLGNPLLLPTIPMGARCRCCKKGLLGG